MKRSEAGGAGPTPFGALGGPIGPEAEAARRREALGLAGDGRALETKALQAAIDEIGKRGGGELRIPPGVYRTGSLFLRSRLDLVLEAGAVLLGSADPADYPLVESRWEGRTRLVHAPLIMGSGLSRVCLRGRGVVDGSGEPWWKAFREGTLAAPRPRLVSFEDSEDILVEGLCLRNSPSWTVNPVRCRRASFLGLRIENPWDSPNTDGINPDSSSSILIQGCFISSGDDCIAIKSGTEAEPPELLAPSEDIVVKDCFLESGHGGVVIGSEMSGCVRGVTVSDCAMSGTDRGIRVKSRRGRGGVVEDLRVRSIRMDSVKVPLAVNLHYHCGGAQGDAYVADLGPRPIGPGTPQVRGLSIEGISARGSTVAATYVDGLAEAPLSGLCLRDVRITMSRGGTAEPPEMSDEVAPRSAAGMLFRDVRGLLLDRVEVEGQDGPPLSLERCERI